MGARPFNLSTQRGGYPKECGREGDDILIVKPGLFETAGKKGAIRKETYISDLGVICVVTLLCPNNTTGRGKGKTIEVCGPKEG